MTGDPKSWRADCFRTRMKEFDAAYAKACASSQPQDWMDAALLAQQFRNVAYAVLTGETPKQEPVWVGLYRDACEQVRSEK